MNDLTHIDLFSGIGGFALAAGWAGFRTIAFCEIEPFCQEVLKARFGAIADAEGEQTLPTKSGGLHAESGGKGRGTVLIPEIRNFDGTRFRGATLLTGGFPCQPFSCAGKRRGKEDDRYLWPEMLCVIQESRPAWVVGENVAGIINMELEQVCFELENEDYDVEPIVIPACAVNAPHRRDRVWIIAHKNTLDSRGRVGEPQKQGHQRDERDAIARDGERIHQQSPDSNAVSDAEGSAYGGAKRKRQRGRLDPHQQQRDTMGGNAPDHDSDAPDAGCVGQEEQKFKTVRGKQYSWDIPWIEVATRLCRVDDGLPSWVHARRVARLQALGNAIVPQVAYEILKTIAEIEGEK